MYQIEINRERVFLATTISCDYFLNLKMEFALLTWSVLSGFLLYLPFQVNSQCCIPNSYIWEVNMKPLHQVLHPKLVQFVHGLDSLSHMSITFVRILQQHCCTKTITASKTIYRCAIVF